MAEENTEDTPQRSVSGEPDHSGRGKRGLHQLMPWWGVLGIGAYLFLSFLVQVVLLVGFWPQPGPDGNGWKETFMIFGWSGDGIGEDARLMIIVLLAGGVGAMVHAFRSFSVYVGNRHFSRSWGWWYLIRPFQGAVLALVFYYALRGGLVTAGGTANGGPTTSEVISPYGFAAISVLSGMFSEQAVAKLRQLAESLFARPESQGDSLPREQTAPMPQITGLRPQQMPMDTDHRQVAILGRGFVERTEARVDGSPRPTEFKTETEVVVTLHEDDLQTVGGKEISVFSAAPGGGRSNVVELMIVG